MSQNRNDGSMICGNISGTGEPTSVVRSHRRAACIRLFAGILRTSVVSSFLSLDRVGSTTRAVTDNVPDCVNNPLCLQTERDTKHRSYYLNKSSELLRREATTRRRHFTPSLSPLPSPSRRNFIFRGIRSCLGLSLLPISRSNLLLGSLYPHPSSRLRAAVISIRRQTLSSRRGDTTGPRLTPLDQALVQAALTPPTAERKTRGDLRHSGRVLQKRRPPNNNHAGSRIGSELPRQSATVRDKSYHTATTILQFITSPSLSLSLVYYDYCHFAISEPCASIIFVNSITPAHRLVTLLPRQFFASSRHPRRIILQSSRRWRRLAPLPPQHAPRF